jgi:hypothetical protein
MKALNDALPIKFRHRIKLFRLGNAHYFFDIIKMRMVEQKKVIAPILMRVSFYEAPFSPIVFDVHQLLLSLGADFYYQRLG